MGEDPQPRETSFRLKAFGARIIRLTAALLMLIALVHPALTDDLMGQASVIDGDTIEIHGIASAIWE